jgi:hypothetical protein
MRLERLCDAQRVDASEISARSALPPAALIPLLLHARHVSTPTEHAGKMDPQCSDIAHAAAGGLEAAASAAAALADLNAATGTAGQTQI